jgi:hypothetical protein
MTPPRELRVFVNCPFDDKYLPIFHAIVFAIHDLGFQARHALIDNSAALRARRIYEELEGSLYSIHERGQVALSPKSKLPLQHAVRGRNRLRHARRMRQRRQAAPHAPAR